MFLYNVHNCGFLSNINSRTLQTIDSVLLSFGLTPPDGQWQEHDDDAAQAHTGAHEVEAGAGVPRHVHQTAGQDWSEKVCE